jgi:hypothetical protein
MWLRLQKWWPKQLTSGWCNLPAYAVEKTKRRSGRLRLPRYYKNGQADKSFEGKIISVAEYNNIPQFRNLFGQNEQLWKLLD